MIDWDDLHWVEQDDHTFLTCPWHTSIDGSNNHLGLIVRCNDPDDENYRVNIMRIEVSDNVFNVVEAYSYDEHNIRGHDLLQGLPILDKEIGQVGYLDKKGAENMMPILNAMVADMFAKQQLQSAVEKLKTVKSAQNNVTSFNRALKLVP